MLIKTHYTSAKDQLLWELNNLHMYSVFNVDPS